MAKRHFGWTAALMMAAATCLAHPSVRAADSPGNEALKKLGLKIAGTLVVTELEGDVKNKLGEARRLSRQLSQSQMEQQAMVSPKEQQRNIKALNDQIGQLKSEINNVTQQMAQVPRNNSQYGTSYGSGIGGIGGYGGRIGAGYGGYGGFGNNNNGATGFANNTAAEQYAELQAYRNQLQQELNQDSIFLNQIKNRVTDPKAKEKIEAEVKQRRDAYHQAIVDLRKAVDATNDKYDELAKSDEVTKALKLIGKGQREKPKLGPSREFLANVKLVEKLEKAEASGETDDPQPAKSRRARIKAKGKTSSKAAAEN